jgi:hypothetical protein
MLTLSETQTSLSVNKSRVFWKRTKIVIDFSNKQEKLRNVLNIAGWIILVVKIVGVLL